MFSEELTLPRKPCIGQSGKKPWGFFLRWKCSSEKVWNQKWQHDSELWKILVQPWRFGSSCLSKALLHLERPRKGEGEKQYLNLFVYFMVHAYDNPSNPSPVVPYQTLNYCFFKCWGHSTEQGLASQCVNHLFFCTLAHWNFWLWIGKDVAGHSYGQQDLK